MSSGRHPLPARRRIEMTEMTTRTSGRFTNGRRPARPASAAATVPNPEGTFVMCWRVLAGALKRGQISNVDGRAFRHSSPEVKPLATRRNPLAGDLIVQPEPHLHLHLELGHFAVGDPA